MNDNLNVTVASVEFFWVKKKAVLRFCSWLSTFLHFCVCTGQYNLRIEDAQLDDDAFFECQAGQSERSDAIVSNPAFLTVQSESLTVCLSDLSVCL